jgi:hypothetical protein
MPSGIYKHKTPSEETKRKMSLSKIGRIVNYETRLKISNSKKGVKLSESHKRNLSISHIGQKSWNKGLKMPEISGKNNPNWKGGISKERQSFGNKDYVNWRNDIFKKDDYTCCLCGRFGGNLNAHHIKKWSDFPKLRYDVKNGETLCKECHKIIHLKNPMEKAILILMDKLKILKELMLQDEKVANALINSNALISFQNYLEAIKLIKN